MTLKSQERIRAIEMGLSTYVTGKACRRGHIAPRYVSNNICADCQSINARKYASNNASKIRGQSKEWRLVNKKHIADYKDRWVSVNRDRARMHNKIRRARKRANGGKLSIGLIGKIMILQRRKCACCYADLSVNIYHLDHIMPLALGGKNEDYNIQLLCPACNLSKHAKHPVEFMQQRGFLL